MRRQHVDLFVAMHHMPKTQARAQLQIASFKNTLQQQDRTTPIERTQTLSFTQVEHGKTIGAAQTFKRPLNAVALALTMAQTRASPAAARMRTKLWRKASV
jgi:multidrug efflux pump subunit AcrA (membrane-fusion protein)